VSREFLVEVRGDAAHVLLSGEIDMLAAPAVRRAVDRALSGPASRVVINLDAVSFIDSTGLGAIITGYRAAERLGRGYRLGPAGVPIIASVLEVTGLDTLILEPATGSESEAIG
jgi:anti-sigma B factor antagonist